MQQPVSIDRQVRTCREYAERQGWSEIPDKAVYADEAMRGSAAHRTQYQKLLAEIAGSNGRPPYDVILIEDLSRMSRDMSEVVRLVKAAPIWNIRVVGVNDGVDTARKGTKLLTYVKAAMNEEFLGDLKARVHGGLAAPVEVIRKLHQEGFYERRAAYRSLVARVEIRSIRRPGRRRVDHWEATITPVLTAGITGLPDCIRIEPNPLTECCTV
jgi:DNA invertase Pin-like site-specific DNA recombinase